MYILSWMRELRKQKKYIAIIPMRRLLHFYLLIFMVVVSPEQYIQMSKNCMRSATDSQNIINCMDIQNKTPNTKQNQHDSPHYEDDYEDQQNHQLDVVIEQKVPQEQVVSLTAQKDKQQETEYRSGKDDMQQKAKLIGKLKNILHLKIEQIKQVKKNINNCKKEIKDIGEEVDREMNKSIIKHSKPQTNINIQSIFQTTKSIDPHVNQLTTQLAKVRAEAKKIRTELKTIQIQVNAPINLINYERATEIRSKIKEADLELKKIREEKQYLEAELKMIEISEEGIELGNDQQIKNSRDRNNQLLNEIKEQKNLMYDLEKEDRILTEKIRYVEELEDQVEVKKNKSIPTVLPKQQVQSSIKEVIEEIREILDKRNKVENERKNILKCLETDVATTEAKNWDIINKLREIDAKLLKHYNSKLKKQKPKKQFSVETTFFEEMDKGREKPIENAGATIKTVYKEPKNDKNVEVDNVEPEPIVLVEKRKSYEFFMGVTEGQVLGNIVLSDEMLGNKLWIKRINFHIDEATIYGVSADYQNEHKNQVRGYKIISKIKPKDILTKVLLIDNSKNEVINFIQVGIDENEQIKFLHIVTSEAKQFKWGNLELCKKNEQKSIRKYENIVIKGKLNQVNDKEAPNYYCLVGFGFSVVYLAPK